MRILTFNCHEAYLHNLSRAVDAMDVVVDLPGHHVAGWDKRMRPVPANARLIHMEQLGDQAAAADVIVVHSITELLTLKRVDRPKVLVLHSSLQGRLEQEKAKVRAEEMTSVVRRYAELTGLPIVIISEMKRRSWGLDAHVITGAVDVADYGGYEGDVASGLRVANHVTQKTRYLRWDLHEEAFADLPVKLLGANPDRPGVRPAAGWEDLKAHYRSHRFLVHTAEPALEDGYNLASLEAMATGMPVLCATHPSCPLENGVDGLVAADAAGLRQAAQRLLDDPELARRLGAAGRETVARRFSLAHFVSQWQAVLEEARRAHADRHAAG